MAEATTNTTTCAIVGGGPAGMILGLLLARAGVDVVVLEKHGDFLRDFRGDTVHASTLTLLDELGLGEKFKKLNARFIDSAQFILDSGPTPLGALRRLPGPHKHIAFIPQWDFLKLIAEAGEQEPSFRLWMKAEATGTIMEDGRVAGIAYRRDGVPGELRAALVVAADGRVSTLRTAAGLSPKSFGAPIDVWWFRVPRVEGIDVAGVTGRFSNGQGMAIIDRGDYYQIAYLIQKGADGALRAEGVEKFRERVGALVPWLADRMSTVTSLDEAKLLDVQLNRLPGHWHVPGLLAIGDAAHAMSPVGGVGINLAVQDGVAAARILAEPLKRAQAGGPPVSGQELAKVRRRRLFPTAVVQGFQQFAHRALFSKIGAPKPTAPPDPNKPKPFVLRVITRFPALQVVPGYFIAIGPLPEHAPEWARRPQS
ncbi:MAG: FAD-dependent oxidoreductase [Segniliparus sp.]|uniref:FAD-dependent oxidoreductase n=1 Tax=Segniliparus sp. TaxID=2804064 RepID=UPI003F337CC4